VNDTFVTVMDWLVDGLVLDTGKDSSFRHRIQAGTAAHPALYPKSTGFPSQEIKR
jgi:hypothetical protein